MDKTYTIEQVAKILKDIYCDPCPCNYNGNDEWLPYCCKYSEICPDPPDELSCWIEFLNHLEEKEKILRETFEQENRGVV